MNTLPICAGSEKRPNKPPQGNRWEIAACPVCGRFIPVRRDGRMSEHRPAPAAQAPWK